MINLREKLNVTLPKAGLVKFIAIDGHGGSGKSTLAKLLSKKLKAEIVHTDDFASWDNPLNWYHDVINTVFCPICDGANTLSYQPASWWEDHHRERVVDQPITNTMIIEGVSSSRSEFDDFISFRIFVDTPQDICLARGVQRDLSVGKNVEEITAMWKGWIADEVKYMQRDDPKTKADMIVDGTRPFGEQIKL